MIGFGRQYVVAPQLEKDASGQVAATVHNFMLCMSGFSPYISFNESFFFFLFLFSFHALSHVQFEFIDASKPKKGVLICIDIT